MGRKEGGDVLAEERVEIVPRNDVHKTNLVSIR
jgi:hypothetical protein